MQPLPLRLLPKLKESGCTDNTLSYQLDGADNQLFSDVLTELTAMVGCAARRWVRDWPVAHKQPWVDGYVLTGMVLGEEGGGDASRLWRFTPHIQDLPTAGDPTASVTSHSPLTLEVTNADSSRTTIRFDSSARIAMPTPLAGRRFSMLGLWIEEAAHAPLPNRTLCPPEQHGACDVIRWPPQ